MPISFFFSIATAVCCVLSSRSFASLARIVCATYVLPSSHKEKQFFLLTIWINIRPNFDRLARLGYNMRRKFVLLAARLSFGGWGKKERAIRACVQYMDEILRMYEAWRREFWKEIDSFHRALSYVQWLLTESQRGNIYFDFFFFGKIKDQQAIPKISSRILFEFDTKKIILKKQGGF